MFEETACLRQNQEAQAVALSLKQRVGFKPHLRAKPRAVRLLRSISTAPRPCVSVACSRWKSVRARQDLGTTILQKSY